MSKSCNTKPESFYAIRRTDAADCGWACNGPDDWSPVTDCVPPGGHGEPTVYEIILVTPVARRTFGGPESGED
jgi:hypothetical protein